MGLLSSGAADDFRAMVVRDPALIGQDAKVPVLLSDDADQYLKGRQTGVEKFPGQGTMTVLILPFPISVNAMFADGLSRRVKSQKYCDWIIEAGYILNRQHPPQIFGQVELAVMDA